MRLLRRRRAEPERPDYVAIMNEATLLHREMKRCVDPTRAEAILVRMRELAVEIGALPPGASTTNGGEDGDS